MELDLARLLPTKFVQRRDAKAVQDSGGSYRPVVKDPRLDRTPLPWKMGDFREHLAGTKTYGHYLCDQDSNVKLFAFDIDLEKTGTWVERPDLCSVPEGLDGQAELDDWFVNQTKVHESAPRADWLVRRNPGRAWYKLQLRTMAELLSSTIAKELGLQVACAYSGNKGVHVYGFTGTIKSQDARAGALLVMAELGKKMGGEFVPGDGHYKFDNEDPVTGFSNLSIEVYPKQDSMEGKSYGNLMRLPLGVNQKNPKDPCFFLDQTAPHTVLAPHPDPVALLNGKSPWKD